MFLRINQRTPFKQKLIQTMIQPTWNKKGFGMTSLRSLETTWNNIFNNHSGYISGGFFSLLIRSNILGEIATNLRTRTVSGACPSCRNPLKNMGKMWGNLPRNPRIKSESYGDLQKFTYLDFLVNKCKQDQLLETTSQTKKACPFIPLSKLGESITRPLQKCGSGSNCWFWRLKKTNVIMCERNAPMRQASFLLGDADVWRGLFAASSVAVELWHGLSRLAPLAPPKSLHCMAPSQNQDPIVLCSIAN